MTVESLMSYCLAPEDELYCKNRFHHVTHIYKYQWLFQCSCHLLSSKHLQVSAPAFHVHSLVEAPWGHSLKPNKLRISTINGKTGRCHLSCMVLLPGLLLLGVEARKSLNRQTWTR